MSRLLSIFSCKKNISKKKCIKDYYDLEKVLGEPGSYGKVFLGIDIVTEVKVAVKRIDCCKYDANEVQILESIQHPNIIQYINCISTDKHVFIITEKCDGDLFDLLTEKDTQRLSEIEAITIITHILEALIYLHDLNIAHCDLKLSNIVFTKTPDLKVKLIDFGSAQKLRNPSKMLHKSVGSIGFMAPELIIGSYNTLCDLWSVGCITFILLFGFNPFNPTSSSNINLVHQSTLRGFCSEVRKGYGSFFPQNIPTSKEAMDFISNLLVLNWKDRMTAQESLNHPWLQRKL